MPPRRVVLAEYFTTDDRTLLFLVREDFEQPVVEEIPKSSADIRAFAAQHFKEEPMPDGSVKTTSDKVSKLSEADYQAFLQNFISPLTALSSSGDPITQPGDIVWFVPHDFLHYLPLHAVKLDGQYLIDRNPICYTPSASVMKYCHQKRKDRRETALILGDPLIYAKDQTLAIQALFQPGKAEIHIEDATKALLKGKLSAAKADIDILHIACHGKFAPDALQSGVQLQDGKLTAEEIFSLKLNADLVTLSACESGVNENKPGDELIGLTRALIYAGTPSVVVSLWEVDALSTSILMSRFYKKLLAGASKVDALQQAQIELRSLTTAEVVHYYNSAREHYTDPVDQQELAWSLATLYFNIGDYQNALPIYQQLYETTVANSPEEERLENLMSQCRYGGNPILKQHPFAHTYYWAPFVLVGDWR